MAVGVRRTEELSRHWYYEDFIRPAALKQHLLPSFALKPFSLLIFRSCPLLHDVSPFPFIRHTRFLTDSLATARTAPRRDLGRFHGVQGARACLRSDIDLGKLGQSAFSRLDQLECSSS